MGHCPHMQLPLSTAHSWVNLNFYWDTVFKKNGSTDALFIRASYIKRSGIVTSHGYNRLCLILILTLEDLSHAWLSAISVGISQHGINFLQRVTFADGNTLYNVIRDWHVQIGFLFRRGVNICTHGYGGHRSITGITLECSLPHLGLWFRWFTLFWGSLSLRL